MLTTIGLSAKNAILIVEFAEATYRRGSGLVAAAIEGARLRLRPILMTSLAFIAGVMPLALSSGGGANSRISIGSEIIRSGISRRLAHWRHSADRPFGACRESFCPGRSRRLQVDLRSHHRPLPHGVA